MQKSASGIMAEIDVETLRRYWVSRCNMIKTLRYRGYSIAEGLYDMTHDEFVEKYEGYTLKDLKEEMTSELVIESQGSLPKILVFWLNEPKLGANIRDVHDKMEMSSSQHAFVVADEGITYQARESLRSLKTAKKFFIDVWTLEETSIFVPDHVFVPEHRICTPAQRREIFKAYGIRPKDGQNKFPRIRLDDIMVRYLGASKGELIEIIRPSETSQGQTDMSYRLVY